MFAKTLDELNRKKDSDLQDEVVVLKAWIQGRVSTKSQVRGKVNGIFSEKASLPQQQKNCEEAIESYRGRCSKCSRELRMIKVGVSLARGESGQNFDREDTNEILDRAGRGEFQILVTNENDRLARSMGTGAMIREKLKRSGIQIYSLSQRVPLRCPECYDFYDDDSTLMIEAMSDCKSQMDIAKIRRNYKVGMPLRIKQGKPAGSLAYGLMKKYRVIGKDFNGNDRLETYYEWDPEKTKIADRIASNYLEGIGVWKICQNLNSEGIPSSQGKKWGRSAILCILKNPAFAGYVRFGWKPTRRGVRKIQPKEEWIMHEASFDPVWSEEYFDRIQNEIKRRYMQGGRAVSSSALLVGLLKCGYCGCSMLQSSTHRTMKNGLPYFYRGYACGGFLHRGSCVHNGKIQKIVDELVIKEVLKLANETTREAYVNKVKSAKLSNPVKLFKQKELEYKRKLDQLARVRQAFQAGVDSLKEYEENKESLGPEIEQLRQELVEFNATANSPTKIDWSKKYVDILSKFTQRNSDTDLQKVRLILSRLITKIEIKSKPLSINITYKLTPQTS